MNIKWIKLSGAGLLLLILSLQSAAAFYDPGLQRWISRDPFEELGFRNAGNLRGFTIADEALYRFVANDPIAHLDTWGLLMGHVKGEDPIGCAEAVVKEIMAAYSGNGPKADPRDLSLRRAHCTANCRVTRECGGGAATAALASWWKEHIRQGHWGWKDVLGGYGLIPWFYDGWQPGDSPGDMAANRAGRQMATRCKSKSCEQACEEGFGSAYPAQ